MANQEQLEILRQGVDIWNGWRRDNPNVQIDLSDAFLSHTDLSGINLKYAYLDQCHLAKAILRDTVGKPEETRSDPQLHLE